MTSEPTTSKCFLLSASFLVVFLGVWHLFTLSRGPSCHTSHALSTEQLDSLKTSGMNHEDILYYATQGLSKDQIQQLADLKLSRDEINAAGGISAFGFTTLSGKAEIAKSPFPSPIQVFQKLVVMLKDPFYDKGPNDKGIAIQLLHSLRRVALGYGLAVIVAIPFGFLLGMSPLISRSLMPYIQILKPISPLAWMPLALYTIKDAEQSSIFVIFICSIWPMLINTAFGVGSVRKELLNIGRTLELSRLQMAVSIILPAAAPTILTGMRISIGIAWLVIVAAEMLIGGTGIGYFVWNEWNGLNIDSMLIAILVIGCVGFFLDWLMALGLKKVQFQE